MRYALLVSIFVLSSAPFGPGLLSQTPGPVAGWPPDGVRTGQTLRLRLDRGDLLQGRVLRLSADSLLLAGGSGTRAVHAAELDSLWLRHSRTARGTLIGGALGAVGALAVSSVICSSIREGFLCGDSEMALAAAVLGGAVTGGLIGHAASGWRLRYADGRTVAARGGMSGPGLQLGVPFP